MRLKKLLEIAYDTSIVLSNAFLELSEQIDKKLAEIKEASKLPDKKVRQLTPEEIIDLVTLGKLPRSEKKMDLDDIVANFPGFENKPFSYPDKIMHMDFEVVEIDPGKDLITDKAYQVKPSNFGIKGYGSDQSLPTIGLSIQTALEDEQNFLLVGLKGCFDFIRDNIFVNLFSLTQAQSNQVLDSIVIKCQEKTGWTYSQVLVQILIRDVLSPTVQILGATPGNMDDTIRLYVAMEDYDCQWTHIPYHQASVTSMSMAKPGDDGFPDPPSPPSEPF